MQKGREIFPHNLSFTNNIRATFLIRGGGRRSTSRTDIVLKETITTASLDRAEEQVAAYVASEERGGGLSKKYPFPGKNVHHR